MQQDDIEQRLQNLARRLQAVEDELAIQHTIIAYGFAVDTGDADGAAALFTDDATYDIDVVEMKGAQAVREMVRSERHQALLPNCAHTMGPLTVHIDGDSAVAVGYSRLYLRNNDDDISLWRLSFNRWQLARRNGRWLIARRSTRLIGHEDAAALLRQP